MKLNKATIKARVLSGLREMGILHKGEKPAAEFIADIPHAYVVHDRNRDKSVAVIQKWFKTQGITSTRRWGNWEYAAMEDAIWQGAEAIGSRRRGFRPALPGAPLYRRGATDPPLLIRTCARPSTNGFVQY